MKKFLLSLIAIASVVSAFAQRGAYKRPAAIGFSVLGVDYVTPQRIRSTSLTSVLNNKQWAKGREMQLGVGLSYFKGLSDHIDFAGTLLGSFARVNMADNTVTDASKLLTEADASVNFKLFSDRYVFTPYLIAGVGASHRAGIFDAFMPFGLGAKFNLFDEGALFLSSQYRVPVTNRGNNYHFVYSIGIAGRIGAAKKPPVLIVPTEPPKDTDGDGIIDSLDKCPTVPGTAKYQGCPIPDTDGDGINDEEDKCPTVAGLAKYQGCPIPDTDGDGVNDEQDKCPTVAGLAKYQGCPIPDTDGDGVNDEEDHCPTLPGTKANNGCPEVKMEIIKTLEHAATRVYFATGSAKLLSTSDKALMDVVKILSEDQNLKLSIEGHTDNVGKADYNQKLSEDRANSVKQYLIKKGVDPSRLISQGFGLTKPIADNKTAAGRSKNRRVVMKVSYD